jgi:putative ABC transport system permease protein
MEKLNNISDLGLIIKYAFRDLVRNYKKIFSIILTLFISLFILSAILTIEESLKKNLTIMLKHYWVEILKLTIIEIKET